MKKRTILISTFLFIILLSSTVFAQEFSNVTEPTSASDMDDKSAIVQYFNAMDEDPNYGGIYFDGTTLVVNVVKNSHFPSYMNETLDAVDIVYQTVSYSLGELEQLKDSLTPYMNDYSIAVLDANEVTNQVDICLTDYNETNISAIKALVDAEYTKNDVLNFVDFSNRTIKSTVATEPPQLSSRN